MLKIIRKIVATYGRKLDIKVEIHKVEAVLPIVAAVFLLHRGGTFRSGVFARKNGR